MNVFEAYIYDMKLTNNHEDKLRREDDDYNEEEMNILGARSEEESDVFEAEELRKCRTLVHLIMMVMMMMMIMIMMVVMKKKIIK